MDCILQLIGKKIFTGIQNFQIKKRFSTAYTTSVLFSFQIDHEKLLYIPHSRKQKSANLFFKTLVARRLMEIFLIIFSFFYIFTDFFFETFFLSLTLIVVIIFSSSSGNVFRYFYKHDFFR